MAKRIRGYLNPAISLAVLWVMGGVILIGCGGSGEGSSLTGSSATGMTSSTATASTASTATTASSASTASTATGATATATTATGTTATTATGSTATTAGTMTTIDFEDRPSAPAVAGSEPPFNAQLSIDAGLPVRFSSGRGYVAVVHATDGSLPAGRKGIAGVDAEGRIDFSAGNPISIRFFSPIDPSVPGITNLVTIQTDAIGNASQTIRMEAYDPNGNLIDVVEGSDVGGAELRLQYEAEQIHEILFYGSNSNADPVLIDSITIGRVIPAAAPGG